MKIKNIIKLCKDSKMLHIHNINGTQWVNNGYAVYPLYGMPEFTPQSLCTSYDISEKLQNQMSLHTDSVPLGFNFEDTITDEELAEPYWFSFTDSGKLITAYKTSQGTYFVANDYLKPFDKMDTELYLRMNGGKPYFAVKQGFELYGFILPYKLRKKDFIQSIQSFALDCKNTELMGISIDWEEISNE